MTIPKAYQQLLFQLYEMYDEREAANIADMVIEHITGLKKIDRIINRQLPLTEEQIQLLNDYTFQLLQHKPVQYVLREAWFGGLKLYVDENVLIPRPETEELAEWIIKDVPGLQFSLSGSFTAHSASPAILDIGTGSGCIAVTLKKKLPIAEIHAVDISESALNIAKQNAAAQKTEIKFHFLNILNTNEWNKLPAFDIIVSNPPYVKRSEASTMQKNVLQHEPHIALFVPDEDPLLFYRTVAAFGLQHLKAHGKLFFEINETSGKEVQDLLSQYGYENIEIKKDLQGKDRMIKAAIANVQQ
ncbi:MAG TPA: peptide chain release factor N(5)-glutamine methyltransferase [Chitinophagaceae bacterium]|jgi:release factor glutamine methyltransferase